ncbi:hypothetical protein BUALT_Bualt11G0097700 [Buddleja alternifolia]|uniref:F-box domain-containing protein n=1 Tax=Buddleja alternifolia TaxID=168488 RepID=A0AAV6WV73_9LAMI|nr:hypothetical protein BUALT_Bualt11G0097700 [Buddleja alternifolia]
MAGNGRGRCKKMRSLLEIMAESTSVPTVQPLIKEAEPDLPNELLEKIFTQLTLRDNIRVSAVCRRWNTVAISVRVADKAPWLMVSPPPKSGDIYEFYDPYQRQRYFLELPELRGARFSYAKDGWVLMYKPNTKTIFFFCPYTRERIELPNLSLPLQIAAFSSSPKCPSCVIFTVKNVSPTIVAVSTCRPGETQWTTVNYQTIHPFSCSIWNKIVFCRGLFYCLTVCGCMGVYNPEDSTWAVHSASPPIFPEDVNAQGQWLRAKCMAECNGDIYFIHTSREKPVIFKLDQTNGVWVEMEDLGGMSFFANFICSHVRTDLLGNMRNSIYFPKVRFYGKRCFSYSFDNDRFYPGNESLDWSRLDPFNRIWIEAPEDLSPFVQRKNNLSVTVMVIMMIYCEIGKSSSLMRS